MRPNRGKQRDGASHRFPKSKDEDLRLRVRYQELRLSRVKGKDATHVYLEHRCKIGITGTLNPERDQDAIEKRIGADRDKRKPGRFSNIDNLSV